MSRRGHSLACAGVAAAAAVALGACGGGNGDEGEPIPRGDARAMLIKLRQIERNVESGACSGAKAKINTDEGALRDKVENLPRDVDADVRRRLAEGVDRLETLVDRQCAEPAQEPTDTTDTTETEETTTTETTDTTDTDDDETTDTGTTETETTDTAPPDTAPTDATDTGTGTGDLPPGQGGGVTVPEEDGE